MNPVGKLNERPRTLRRTQEPISAGAVSALVRQTYSSEASSSFEQSRSMTIFGTPFSVIRALEATFGGGVMSAQLHLFERVRKELQRSLNRYVDVEEVGAAIASYVVPPGLGALAGPLGALALAADSIP